MAKVLLTGSSGFIGSHLLKQLEDEGNEVIKLKHDLLRDETGLSLLEKTKDVEYVYHLASYGNMANQHDEFEALQANIANLWNLLQATKEIPYKAFINVSSSSVTLPYQTFYSATKAAGEKLCLAFVSEYNKPIVSFRPYSVYGPGEQQSHLIPTVFHNIIQGQGFKLSPKGTHDFVYIDDMINDLVAIANSANFGGVYECGTGVPTTNKRVVEIIEELTGKKANITGEYPRRSYDVKSWASNTIDMGKIQLQEGLERYYEWYKKQRS